MYKDLSSSEIEQQYNKLDKNDPVRMQINNLLNKNNNTLSIIPNMTNTFFHNIHNSLYDNISNDVSNIMKSMPKIDTKGISNYSSSSSSYSNSYINNNGREYSNISSQNNINGKKTSENTKIFREGDKYVEITTMSNGKMKIRGNRGLVEKVKKAIKNNQI